MKYCTDFSLEFRCCGSCHFEWDEGYGYPLEREFNGEQYELCCSGVVAIDKTKEDELDGEK